ncbi:MAG: hypothetical protein M3119_09315 [Verrucomicrobiota bacterium]|nr:hypothetical protein [Verrucomicrobiota bacterium]
MLRKDTPKKKVANDFYSTIQPLVRPNAVFWVIIRPSPQENLAGNFPDS